MYLNISTEDNVVFQNIKSREYSYNSYDDIGVF
jgi:hypothetical protein